MTCLFNLYSKGVCNAITQTYNCYVHETYKTSLQPHCLKYAGHFVLAPHKGDSISLLMGYKGKGFKNEVWGAEGNLKSEVNSFMNTETYQANTTVQQFNKP